MPSDPVTTDPKGEAGPAARRHQTSATRNTPALIMTRQPMEKSSAGSEWINGRLSDGRAADATRHHLWRQEAPKGADEVKG